MENANKSSINIPQGSNFAPIKPFLDLKNNKPDKDIQDHYLVKALKEKYDTLINEHKEEWREIIRAGKTNALFIQGEQVLKINSFDGMPRAVPANKRDPRHKIIINKMQYYSTNWQDKWRSSKPDVMVEPYSNQDQAIAQAKKANTVVDYLESKFYNNWFDLHEGINAQVWGWYGRRVRPDYTAKSFSAFKEIVEDVETPIGKGWGKCPECGYKGNEAKAKEKGQGLSEEGAKENLCPKCGSEQYEFDAPVIQLIPKVTGREKIFIPEIICEPLVLPSTRFNLRKRCEESSHLIVEKQIEESALRRIIGNIRFPEGESGNDFGLDAIETLATRGAALYGQSTESENKKSDKITLTEMYLSADDLWDIKIGGDEKTVEGIDLPKGKRMSDVFPNGCCVIGINGLALVLGIYADHHSDSVTAGVYHLKMMSGTGRGIDDAIPVQKQFNRRYSQIDNIFGTRSSPATLFIENLISPRFRKMLNQPGADIPVNMSQLPDGMNNLAHAIYPLQAADVPNGLMETTFNNLESMLQVAYHITDFAGGNPRVKNDTATGARILDANADALFSPSLGLKADVCVETAKKGFYKWVKCNPVARFVPFKAQPKSGAVGIEISGKDVDGEYRWSYVPGSEAPKNKFSEMEKRMGFFAQFQGGIEGWLDRRKTNPKEIAEIERDFDVNFETDSYDTIGKSCRLRYENAKNLLKLQSQSLPEPDFLGLLLKLEPSLEITEGQLEEKALWFQSLLDSEEGLRSPTILRKLISAFIVAFKELSKGQTIEMQKDAAEVQIASNQPIQDAQNAQQQQQLAAQSEQQTQQMVGEAIKVANENDQAAAERAHQADQQNNENLMRLAEMANQQELAQQQKTEG